MPQLNYENPNSLHQRQLRSRRQELFGKVTAGLFAAALFVMGVAAVAARSLHGKRSHLLGWRAVMAGIGFMLVAALPGYFVIHRDDRRSRWVWPAVVSFLLGIGLIVLAQKIGR